MPKEIIEGAISIIRDQIDTPRSPCKKTEDGKTSFCAAAALAIAGLELEGEEKRKQTFISEITDTGSSEPIREVFREFGWPVEACDKSLVVNDALPEKDRTRSVIQFFESALDN